MGSDVRGGEEVSSNAKMKEKEQRVKEKLSAEDVVFNFYGKDVDQNKRVVVGAVVTINVSFFDPTVDYYMTGIKTVVVNTDNHGLFHLENQHGRDFMSIFLIQRNFGKLFHA